MEIGNLWLIPVSIFFNCSLYWVQKHYLIKWFCRRFLSESVQLECDLPSHENANAKSNGLTDTRANGFSGGKASDKGTYHGKKLVSQGDVNGVAME